MKGSRSIPTTPLRKHTGAFNQHGTLRAPPRNVFQAKQQLEKEKKSTRGLISKAKKALDKGTRDKVLRSYLGNRDFISFRSFLFYGNEY